MIEKLAVIALLPYFGSAQSLAPPEALARYLARPHDRGACSDAAFAVRIDAELPKLKKQGTMSGLKLISKTGQAIYRGLTFAGDNLVKTAVIARFLTNETETTERGAALTEQNYSFVYTKTADYNGAAAFVFLLKPRRKRAGMFKGELWLNADTAEPLRLWGDLVKSPSIFVRSFRFVQDYRISHECAEPLRLLLSIQTRLAGRAEMAVWLEPVKDAAPPAGDGAPGAGEPGPQPAKIEDQESGPWGSPPGLRRIP